MVQVETKASAGTGGSLSLRSGACSQGEGEGRGQQRTIPVGAAWLGAGARHARSASVTDSPATRLQAPPRPELVRQFEAFGEMPAYRFQPLLRGFRFTLRAPQLRQAGGRA